MSCDNNIQQRNKRRIEELVAHRETGSNLAVNDNVKGIVGHVETATGIQTGLYLDEHDHLEARWTIKVAEHDRGVVINATFGENVEMYMFDRDSERLSEETSSNYQTAAHTIVELIETLTRRSTGGGWL